MNRGEESGKKKNEDQEFKMENLYSSSIMRYANFLQQYECSVLFVYVYDDVYFTPIIIIKSTCNIRDVFYK